MYINNDPISESKPCWTTQKDVLDQQRKWLGFLIQRKCKMDGEDGWELIYYPVLDNPKTKEVYEEPRAVVGKNIFDKNGVAIGIDIKEVPLRYLEYKN